MRGMKLHAKEPLPKRPESSLLAVPTLPVRLIEGKKAARAAPMLALAARNRSSAARTSGRRSSASEGNPAGSAARPATCGLSNPAGSLAPSIGPPTSSRRALASASTRPSYAARSERAASTWVCACARSTRDTAPSWKRRSVRWN